MSVTISPLARTERGFRALLGIGGAVALVVGVVILVWPGHAAVAATALFAVYAILAGLVYAGLGVFAPVLGGWSRLGHLVLGVLFVVGGVIAFASLRQTAVWLAVFVGITIGIVWIVEGVVALTTIGLAASPGWTVVYAVLSILGGVALLLSPLWGAAALWWLLGFSLVVLGIVQILRAVIWRAGTKEIRPA